MSESIPKVKKPPMAGKLDISDAKIISETKVDNETTSTKEETVDSSYVKNLQDQETVTLNDKSKGKVEEKVVIDFMNEDHIRSFTAGETKKADVESDETKSNFEGKSVDDLKADIKRAEEESTKNFTAKDFEDIARFIIFLIDTGLSSGLKWWSGDSSDAAYSLPEKKKEMLVYQLTLILTKYQAKFSIEFMFVLTILIVYAPAFVKAKNKRKELKTPEHPGIQTFEEYQNEGKTEKASAAAEGVVAPLTQNLIKPKRRRGNPGKA